MQKSNGLYIELPIAAPLEKLWAQTQTPELHQQWDLRFTSIKYLPKTKKAEPQKFLYTTQIGFGLAISGEGESTGSRHGESGEATSALKFWSNEYLSLIRHGSGYWKYIPNGDHIRFLTWYDYQVRFGLFGYTLDRLVFRPLMGWATAWSFDCLRRWLEDDVPPRISIRATITQVLIHLVLSIIWIYQGLIPKILYPDSGELEILQASGLFSGYEPTILFGVGIGEIVFGLLFLFVASRLIHYVNIFALAALALGALGSQSEIFVAPFNPVSLNLAMIGLSIAALINYDTVVKASNCLRRPPNL